MLSIGNIVRKSQPAVFWCMRGLTKPKREAIYTLFAFCRHIDNLKNSVMPMAEKIELLNAWREELDNIYEKKVPITNIGRKIYKNCMRFNLPKKLWEEILNSAFLDVPTPIFAPENDVFDRYVYGTAVMPFQLSLKIIGGGSDYILAELAKCLGQGVMITYLLRDIKDDSRSEHVFIPREILERAGVQGSTARAIIENKNLAAAREELSHQAEKAFARADRILNKMNRNTTMPLSFIKNISECQLNIMKKRGWDIISPKPHVNFRKRLQIAWKTITQ